jgi:hypothetical protein
MEFYAKKTKSFAKKLRKRESHFSKQRKTMSEKQLLESKTSVLWTETCTRKMYLDYYEDNLAHRPYLWSFPLDFSNSNHDVLLVRRVNDDHNTYLAASAKYQKLPDNFYDTLDYDVCMQAISAGGWLFSTKCCQGWLYGMTRCICGSRKLYLHVEDLELINLSNFNLKSTNPIGTATMVGL